MCGWLFRDKNITIHFQNSLIEQTQKHLNGAFVLREYVMKRINKQQQAHL